MRTTKRRGPANMEYFLALFGDTKAQIPLCLPAVGKKSEVRYI